MFELEIIYKIYKDKLHCMRRSDQLCSI